MAKEQTPLGKLMAGFRGAFDAITKGKDEFDSEEDRMAAVHESLDLVEKALEENVETPPVTDPPTEVEKAAMKCPKCGEMVQKTGEGKEGEGQEELLKSLNPAQLALIEKAQSDATDALSLVEKMQDENDQRVALAKAHEILGQLPGDKVAFATVLKALTPEETKTLEGVLKAANELIKAGKPFEEVGKSGKAGESTPEGQLKVHAQDIRKSEPKLSEAQAMTKAAEQHPELYAASVGR